MKLGAKQEELTKFSIFTHSLSGAPSIMEELSLLKPAETLILLKGTSVDLKELIQTTFLDLLLHGVLTIEVKKKRKRSQPYAPEIEYKYICKGPNYEYYSFQEYEKIFVKHLKMNPIIKYLEKDYFERVYNEIESSWSYKGEILNAIPYGSYVNRKGFMRLLTKGRTGLGKRKANEIRMKMASLGIR